jgi:hypothetical protein
MVCFDLFISQGSHDIFALVINVLGVISCYNMSLLVSLKEQK